MSYVYIMTDITTLILVLLSRTNIMQELPGGEDDISKWQAILLAISSKYLVILQFLKDDFIHVDPMVSPNYKMFSFFIEKIQKRKYIFLFLVIVKVFYLMQLNL